MRRWKQGGNKLESMEEQLSSWIFFFFNIVHEETPTEVFKQENDLVPTLGCFPWQMIRRHSELVADEKGCRPEPGPQ